MFPTMSPEGARGAIAWYAATRIIDNFDQGLAGSIPVLPHDPIEAAKRNRPTAQSALDAVCARARAQVRSIAA